MMKRYMLEVFLPVLCVFLINSIGHTEEIIKQQKKTQVIKAPTQSVKPASGAEYIRTIEQDAASMKAKAKQFAQMMSSIKRLRGGQRSHYLEKAMQDANSLLRHIKVFEKKLGDLHISASESGMNEADKAKIRRHLDGIQEYMSEAISITHSVAAGDHKPLGSSAYDVHKPVGVARLSYKTRRLAPRDHEPQELAVEESDSERPDYADCASNIDSEDCSGLNSCFSCCSGACGDIPDVQDSRAYSSYQFCIADCRDHCSCNVLVCIERLSHERNTNNIDALTGL
jgi:hypothetical protein